MLKKIVRLAGFASLSIMLGACMVPEKFTAEIDYQADASYSYKFAGTAVDVPAIVQLAKLGGLNEKAKQDLDNEAIKIRSNPEVKKAVYVGNGRFELQSEGKRAATESTHLFNFLQIVTDPNTGVTTIASNAVKEGNLKELSSLHIQPNGTLKIHLPSNAKVLSHNAHSTPLFGKGDYAWKIQELSERPVMTVRFESAAPAPPQPEERPVQNAESCDASSADCATRVAPPAPPPRNLSMPNSPAILWPLFALAAWTMCMAVNIACRRVRATLRGEADIDQFAYGESGPLPEALILANRNYMNLLELPMLFYVVCVLTYVTGVQSTWLVTLAWAYVVLRVLHSFVHLTYNHVLHRFALFATSNVILTLQWLLLGTALISHT
ncbi:MAPEG family protein [Diaphorobacter sp. HDW4B]|uniref:MAPEG family protein n=1 Tax=Diaphorobacter sp. HDW4B TaxID=2714925 RepID=UPI001F0F0D06|nr:MAPEG family protein [Diaphorobacter sp. HDW4B]